MGTPITTGYERGKESPEFLERVSEVHAKYKAAVEKLYYRYRDLYDPKAGPLEMI